MAEDCRSGSPQPPEPKRRRIYYQSSHQGQGSRIMDCRPLDDAEHGEIAFEEDARGGDMDQAVGEHEQHHGQQMPGDGDREQGDQDQEWADGERDRREGQAEQGDREQEQGDGENEQGDGADEEGQFDGQALEVVGEEGFQLPLPHVGEAAQEHVLSSNDLLLRIIHFLSFPRVASSALVNKAWRGVAESKEFWSNVNMEGRPVSLDQLIAIVERHQEINVLNIIGLSLVPPGRRPPDHIWIYLTQLVELHMGGGVLEACELALPRSLPKLRKWVIREGVFGLQGNPEVVIQHSSMATLELDSCRTGRLNIQGPGLVNLSVKNLTAGSMSVTAPGATRLTLTGCSKMAEPGLRAAVLRLTSLRDLDLTGNLPLNDETLREIGNTCHQVTHLVVRHCFGLTMTGVRGFPEIRSLDLGNCDSITPTGLLPSLDVWTTLEEINLESCSLLTHVQLSLGRLRLLQLQGCRALVWVDLKCPALTELRLSSDTQKPTGCAILKRITLQSRAMESICWRAFPALEHVALDCPSLRSVDLSDCDALLDGVFDTFGCLPGRDGRSSGCPNLENLRLDSCNGLWGVRLESSSLSRLSLAGGKELRQVELVTPNLQLLCLDECKEIKRVTLMPAAVRFLNLGSCAELEGLCLDCPHLDSLDVTGCGSLVELKLKCPTLHSLNAKFCAELSDATLVEAVHGAPAIRHLLLSVCMKLERNGLAALGALRHMRLLDVSYTQVEGLDPVYESCPGLETLVLASCTCLGPDALDPILPPLGPAAPGGGEGGPAAPDGGPAPFCLPALRSLDIGYCLFPTHTLMRVLTEATRLTELILGGGPAAVDSILQPLNNPGGLVTNPSGLRSLSLPACRALRACWLGLHPASPEGEAAQELLLAMGPHADFASVDLRTAWRPVPTLLSGLEQLKLNLGGVRSLALALPHLTRLECDACTELRSLELRCPLLSSASFRNCPVTRSMLEDCLASCPQLQQLDLQYNHDRDEEICEFRDAHVDIEVLFNPKNAPSPYHDDSSHGTNSDGE